MALSTELSNRSQNNCELCGKEEHLYERIVPPKSGVHIDEVIAICDICKEAIETENFEDENHWRVLNDSMWSHIPAVQVTVYRLLKKIPYEWAKELLASMYLDAITLEWAQNVEEKIIHTDAYGNELLQGDTVTLIQDLDVKGAGFTAKRGTAVRRIMLVHDNSEHIEGKVNGQQIVILTKYVKKS